MPTDTELIDALQRFNAKQVQLAGQRYTPGIEPGAPNLRIASLLTAVESVACGPAARDRFLNFVSTFREAWRRAKHSCEKQDEIQRKLDVLEPTIGVVLPRIRTREAAALLDWEKALTEIISLLEGELQRWRAEEQKISTNDGSDTQPQENRTSSRDAIQSHINDLSRCIGLLREEQEFVASPAGQALTDPFLLISGSWGTGKTHLLCDVTQQRVGTSQPTLLVLAKSFQGSADLLSLIADEVIPRISPAELVAHLQVLGRSRDERSLIIVDGVNEGRRADWRRAITALLALVRDRTHIALIVSCRTPFERASITPSDLAKLHEISHRGFEEQEFDAQAAFFHFYNLPLPEVPLLDAEFSRPLTLKLICQSLRNLTGKKLRDGFSGIASGQRGMTYVLESFVNRVGDAVEKEFSLAPMSCWWLLKGSRKIADQRIAGFACNMAATLSEYVRPRDARKILAAHFPRMARRRQGDLLDALRTNGLIDEDVIWYRAGKKAKSRTVYRLPYQRFSDHLVARHLLDRYLAKSSSEASIKRAFARGSPLGRIFRRGRYSHSYARAGWVQAIITEFPERVKKRIPNKRRELLFFLPRAAQHPSMYFEPFVEGLFWRDPAAFTEGTRRVLNACLRLERQDAWNKVVDALVALSTKPKHPYHARRLYSFLEKFSMAERDLRWSEYLRHHYGAPSAHRLLAWAERLKQAEMQEDTASELVVLLSLLLTTVVRRDRDLTTRALVIIGERYPRILFEHAVITLSFNDPYVCERMLAAAYGVAMARADDAAGRAEFLVHLAWLARALYRKMFTPQARHQTTHALRRDYALGIIRLAQRARCVRLPSVAKKYLSPPFAQVRSPFPQVDTIPVEVQETGKFAIHMDFGNYTIGHLILGRANYDHENADYKRIRKQIDWRIFDLGLRKEAFKDIDAEIGRFSFYANQHEGSRVDRYGKKYSWIAYFEMYGVRENMDALPEWRRNQRVPDCDVDPTFPTTPPLWTPPMPSLFNESYSRISDWLANGPIPDYRPLLRIDEINGARGPWILVEGFTNNKSSQHGFELWTLLRGLFVRPRDTARLRELYLTTEYPGNDAIPAPGEDYYVFGGEVGRSLRYAPDLLRTDGSYLRQTASAFDEHRWIPDASETGERGDVELTSPDGTSGESDDIVRVVVRVPRGRSERVAGVRVELPSRRFAWESYHSSLNDLRGFHVPAPSLIEKLQLHTKNRGIDFYDSNDTAATLYREGAAADGSQRFSVLYIRENLLRAYLRQTRQTLVWCNWGERNWERGEFDYHSDEPPDAIEVFQRHGHIHRRFVTFSDVVSR